MPLTTTPHHHCTKFSGHIFSRESTATKNLATLSHHHYTKYNDHDPPTEANAVRPPISILHQYHAMHGEKSAHNLPKVTKETSILASILHHHDVSHGATRY